MPNWLLNIYIDFDLEQISEEKILMLLLPFPWKYGKVNKNSMHFWINDKKNGCLIPTPVRSAYVRAKPRAAS